MEGLYLECECHSDEHMHIYRLDLDDPAYPVVYITHHLCPYGFWGRLVAAVKYLFGYRCKFGDFDESIIQNVETARKLRDVMDRLIQANEQNTK